MRTFAQLRTEVLQWLDESAATATSSSYLNVQYALKQAHTMRLTEDNWKFMLWPKYETFSTVSGQAGYSLHQEFLRPFTFRNTTRNTWLVETPSRNIDPAGIDIHQDQNVSRFQLWGRAQVQNQPTSGSVVTIVSSSASDTEATKAITIYGDTALGMTSESLTPNGTTPVVGTTTFTQILSVTKGMEWIGSMTATTNSGAVTILSLFPGEFGRSYQQLQFLGLPAGSETITYRFYRKPRELVNDTDLTDIPPPFERVLVYDALLLMGAYDNRLDGGRLGLWRGMRDDLDFQLRQSQLEGQSLGAEARYIGERSSANRMMMPD